MKRVALLYLFLAGCAFATTRSTDGSASDVQAKIDASATGDIVTIPSGSFTWATGVTCAKAIQIQGAGSGRVIARSTSSVAVGTGTKTFTLNASGLAITNGQTLKIYRTGGEISGGASTGTIPWMQGTVTSYSGTTLTMSIATTNATGTHPLWIITTPATTTITHSAGSSYALSLSEPTAGSIEVSGLRFVTGTGTGGFLWNGHASGGKPTLIHDNYFESTTNMDCIRTDTNRGVIYNCSFVALPVSMAQLAIHHKDVPDASWATASTMGTADTTGQSNLYVEDCDFHAWLNACDIDDNAKATFRHCLFNNAGFGTHGADTSNYGVRHYECYDSEFVYNGYSDGNTMNLNWWFYLRGGTGVIADNIMPHITSTDYGSKTDVNMTVMNLQRSGGPHGCWGAGVAGNQYPAPRQVGMGYVTGASSSDSFTYNGDSEPLYIFGNTTANGSLTITTTDYGGTDCTGPDSSANYVVAGRDYIVGTAKPGYVKYTYPHPLRGGETPPTSSPTITTTTLTVGTLTFP